MVDVGTGVDVRHIISRFEAHLGAAMTSGARTMRKSLGKADAAGGADTLIMNECFRKCAADALDREVAIGYAGPEAPRRDRGRGWLARGEH